MLAIEKLGRHPLELFTFLKEGESERTSILATDDLRPYGFSAIQNLAIKEPAKQEGFDCFVGLSCLEHEVPSTKGVKQVMFYKDENLHLVRISVFGDIKTITIAHPPKKD